MKYCFIIHCCLFPLSHSSRLWGVKAHYTEIISHFVSISCHILVLSVSKAWAHSLMRSKWENMRKHIILRSFLISSLIVCHIFVLSVSKAWAHILLSEAVEKICENALYWDHFSFRLYTMSQSCTECVKSMGTHSLIWGRRENMRKFHWTPYKVSCVLFICRMIPPLPVQTSE